MLCAVLLIAGSIFGYMKVQNSLKSSDVLVGTIVKLKLSRTNDPSRTRSDDFEHRSQSWVATFSYRFDGRDYRQDYPTFYSEKEKPEIGTQVEIYVSRDNPKSFLINEFAKLYSLEATLAFMAFVLLFIGLPMHFLLGPNSKLFPKPPKPPWTIERM